MKEESNYADSTYVEGSFWRSKISQINGKPYDPVKVVKVYRQFQAPSESDIIILWDGLKYTMTIRYTMDEHYVRTYCESCNKGRRAGCSACYPERDTPEARELLRSQIQALYNNESSYRFG